MQPDDFGQRDKKCCMCGELTGRVIDGQPVCDRHFLEGWGRLPDMPLPAEREPSVLLGTYPCSKCGSAHTYTSKIGKRHLKYRG